MKSIVVALILWLPGTALAQDKSPSAAIAPSRAVGDPLPDPAAIEVPDVTPPTDPKVRNDGYKFYYFHNPDVTFGQAYADLAECRSFLFDQAGGAVPGFVPWTGAAPRRAPPATKPEGSPISPYGLVGEGLAAIILPKMERGARSNIMRRCMGTRGYSRYAIPESAFDQLNDGKDEDTIILMQAKLASGPKPKDEEVTR